MSIAPPPTGRATCLEVYRRHVNRTIAMLADINGVGVEARAEGPYVHDHDGRRHLDCGGYGVMLLGHGHPRVCAAVQEQLAHQPMGTRLLLSSPLAQAAEAIAGIAPSGLDYVYLLNSGADAVELAFKLARLGGRRHVVAMQGGFHGKTLGALSITHHDAYRRPFEPLVPGVTHVPFGEIESLEAALAGPSESSCVFMEPVQAEAGVIIPPEGYLTRVEQLCHEHGHWLVLDEIQTGLGRVGSWWAACREGITPDILLAGKILSGGVIPSSAVIATAEVWRPLNRDPFLHTATFANMPLAAAAATATIAAIEEEGLIARGRTLGETLRDGIAAALEDSFGDRPVELRSIGLLIGIDLGGAHLVGELIYELLQRRVLVNHSLSGPTTLRLTPCVYMTERDVDWLCSALGESLKAISKRYPVEERIAS
jgi:putrescine aminotransferase